MNFRCVPQKIITGLLLIYTQFSYAAYWDEAICGYSVSDNNLDPGESFTAQVQVSAQRNANSNIPVNFYFSQTPSIGSSSQYLGSTQVYLPQTGSFCSGITNKTLTMPTATTGSCFGTTSGYIVFNTGDDEKSTVISTVPSGFSYPEITSFTPTSGKPGTIVTITGNSFDDNVAVYIDGIEAPRVIDSQTSLRAEIPHGVTTSKITLKRVGPGYEFCVPPMSISTNDLVITDTYCLSEAVVASHGRIDYVSSSEFTNNVIGTAGCPVYTDNTSMVASAAQGELQKEMLVQFGTCGSADYSKLFKAYVDWNQDDDFNDPGEFIVDAPSVSSNVLYQILTDIPSTASVGTTRVRLIMALYYAGWVDTSADVGACGLYPYGETQDYALDITASGGQLRGTLRSLSAPASSSDVEPLINNPASKSTAPDLFVPDIDHPMTQETFTYPARD